MRSSQASENVGSMSELLDRLCMMQENDLGNASRFVERYGSRVLYVDQFGWFVWNGKRWKSDPTEKAVRKLAHKTAKAIFDESKLVEEPLKRTKFAIRSGHSPRITAMQRETRGDLERSVEELDRDPWLLNVENGTLDLRTGKLGKHKQDDLITKLAPIKFDLEAKHDQLDQFFERIMPDEELREFIQRFSGYTMTGDTGEQCLVFSHGMGANGKTTLQELLSRILGDYATVLPFTSLLHNDRHQGGTASPDLARLVGARMVCTSEPDINTRFSEALLKQLTGGDTIAARKLHKDFFEFKAKFKLWLTGNHKPNIKGNDEGIWRRIKLVPFNETIPEEERDAELPEKLWNDRSGILNWMIAGCLAWQKTGLQTPAAVTDATKEYRRENDPIGDFFEDCIVEDHKGQVSSARLRERYEAYCIDNGLQSVSQKAFAQILRERGYENDKIGGLKYWMGFRLLDIEPSMVHSEYAHDTNSLQRKGY